MEVTAKKLHDLWCEGAGIEPRAYEELMDEARAGWEHLLTELGTALAKASGSANMEITAKKLHGMWCEGAGMDALPYDELMDEERAGWEHLLTELGAALARAGGGAEIELNA